MIDKNLACDILFNSMSTGASFSEIFIEHNNKFIVSLVNGKVDNVVSGIDFGLGIRIFFNGNTIYSYTNDFSKDNLLQLSKSISSAVFNISPFYKTYTFNFDKCDFSSLTLQNVKKLPSSVKKSSIVDMLKFASSCSFDFNSLISETSCSYSHSIQDVCIINSNGLWTTDKRVRTRSSINVVASNNFEKQTGYISTGALSGFEFYDNIDFSALAKEASRSAITMLKSDYAPSGKMPVVIDNGFGGVIFHEACGHGLEAIKIAKGDSTFCGKIGQKVANEKVTAIDDGTISKKWGSINVDDEGTPTQKTVLIEKGILKNYLVDNFYGEKISMNSTGSCRRESYKFSPVPRMRNTFIANGNDKKQDIISNTEKGLFAKYMGGGSVNPATGEFNFSVREAYLIEKGKITTPVRGATLIGKGAQVLNNIDMVSDNLELSDGICGASSGSIPTCVGQPTIRVSEIIVGGRG